MGLVRSLQPWNILLIYCNNQLKKYITPFSKTSEGATLLPPSDVMSEAFFVPFHCHKTLLHKSSWVIKPGPWSQSQIIFFRDHQSDIVHRKLSKGMTEDEMVGCHQWLNGHKFEQPPRDGERQGSLACCSPWDCKESDTAEWLNNNKSQKSY